MATLTTAYGHTRERLSGVTMRPVRDRARRALAKVHGRAALNLGTGISGLGCLSAAAYQVSTGVGLAATGVALLVLNWWTGGDS